MSRPALFDEFRRRYLAELAGTTQRAALGRLRALASAQGPLVLLAATRDVDHSQAAVLADLLRPPADPADPGRPEARLTQPTGCHNIATN
jgi:uncharacterized protein YeaO (DUF488 family)